MKNTPPNDSYIQVNSQREIKAVIENHCSKSTFLYLAPNAVFSVGMGIVWGHLEYLKAHHPSWQERLAVDCGESAGYVLSALRHGAKVCFFSGALETLSKLQNIAEQRGGKVLNSERSPITLKS